jgi:hypothetical protein
MNDEFDDELRRSLHSQADRIPRRPDLSASAISRARGIRRRRQVAGVVAATALVAIAVPIGLRVGDMVSNSNEPVAPATTGPTVPESVPPPTTATDTDQPPETAATDTGPTSPGDNEPEDETHVALDLQSLPDGEAPAVAVREGRTITADGFEVEVPGNDFIADFAVADDAVYVRVGNNELRMLRLGSDGSTQDFGVADSAPVASDDGLWVAWSGREDGEHLLMLVDESAETIPSPGDGITLPLPGRQSAYVVSVLPGTVYYVPANAFRPLLEWSSGDVEGTEVADVQGAAVSPDGGIVAHFTADPTNDEDFCGAVLDVSAGGELWEKCNLVAKSFSPDGSLVVATGEVTDGYAPRTFAILDTSTGDLVHRFDSGTGDPIAFHDWVFEDDTHLIVRAEQAGGSALLRCDVETGDCEAAAPWTEGTDADIAGGPFDLAGTL